MRKLLQLAFAAAMVTVIISCSDDSSDDAPSNQGSLNYSYYPTNVGHEIIYDAKLIVRDPVTGDDTAEYQIMEVVESTFTDNQGRPTQRLERYHRATPADPWVIADVWTANMTSTHVERNEENTPYIKLIFPLLENKSWNGNSLNTLGQKDYVYDWVDQPYTVNSIPFDSTLRVQQANEDNFVYTEIAEEVFATGVGLVYKNQVYIVKDYTIPNQVGVKEQRLYSEKLVSWSN
jgi:hypothetical protein